MESKSKHYLPPTFFLLLFCKKIVLKNFLKKLNLLNWEKLEMSNSEESGELLDLEENDQNTGGDRRRRKI